MVLLERETSEAPVFIERERQRKKNIQKMQREKGVEAWLVCKNKKWIFSRESLTLSPLFLFFFFYFLLSGALLFIAENGRLMRCFKQIRGKSWRRLMEKNQARSRLKKEENLICIWEEINADMGKNLSC